MECGILFPNMPCTSIFLTSGSITWGMLANIIFSSKTAFTRCRHIFKTVKNATAAKFELASTRCRHNLKTVGKLIVKTRSWTFMLKKSTYTLRIDHSRSKSVEKWSVYDAVSNLYRLGSVFKIYRFRNLPAKNVPFSCEREAYPSHFHRFQNLPASCERSLSWSLTDRLIFQFWISVTCFYSTAHQTRELFLSY